MDNKNLIEIIMKAREETHSIMSISNILREYGIILSRDKAKYLLSKINKEGDTNGNEKKKIHR